MDRTATRYLRSRHGNSRLPDCPAAQANVARIYDFMLGGKDSFAADRAAAEQLLALIAGLRAQLLKAESPSTLNSALAYRAGPAGSATAPLYPGRNVRVSGAMQRNESFRILLMPGMPHPPDRLAAALLASLRG
jgi:S-adenosyl methyltransferase